MTSDERPLVFPETVDAALVDYVNPTPPLKDYAQAYALDDNLPWRLGIGHLVNLLDEALDQLGLLDGPEKSNSE